MGELANELRDILERAVAEEIAAGSRASTPRMRKKRVIVKEIPGLKYYSAGEFAEIIGVTKQCVYKLVKRGWLMALKLGPESYCRIRIPSTELQRLLTCVVEYAGEEYEI